MPLTTWFLAFYLIGQAKTGISSLELSRHLGVNYGWVLLAWSAAGVVGPGFVAAVKDRTGSYAGALPATAALLVLATLLPILVRPPVARRARA